MFAFSFCRSAVLLPLIVGMKRRYICWESEIPRTWEAGRILQTALKLCAIALYTGTGIPWSLEICFVR